LGPGELLLVVVRYLFAIPVLVYRGGVGKK
jgi:hypothetical protein